MLVAFVTDARRVITDARDASAARHGRDTDAMTRDTAHAIVSVTDGTRRAGSWGHISTVSQILHTPTMLPPRHIDPQYSARQFLQNQPRRLLSTKRAPQL